MANEPEVTGPEEARDIIYMECRKDETSASALARYGTNPSVSAGLSIQRIKRNKLFTLEITPLIKQLEGQANAVNQRDLGQGESMLVAQAATLDALFHRLVSSGLDNMSAGYRDAAECCMRLAFKAQSQCRSNWEAISKIQNPSAVAFVKANQANIATGPQQNILTRGNSEITPDEMNGVTPEMDPRSTPSAIGADSPNPALALHNGASDRRRKGEVLEERGQRKYAVTAAAGGKAAKGDAA